MEQASSCARNFAMKTAGRPRNERVTLVSSDKGMANNFHLDFLQGLPQAIAVVRVDLDMMGRPSDLVPVYGNQALFSLFGACRERFIGFSLINSRINLDKKWLYAFWETSCHGRVQELTDFWPALGRHLMVTCHQPQFGYCTCLFQDVTEHVQLEKEREKNRQKLEALLHSAVDVVFQMDHATQAIANLEESMTRYGKLFKGRSVPEALLQQGIFAPGQDDKIGEMASLVRNGLMDCTREVRARVRLNAAYTWHSLTLVGYPDPQTRDVCIIGFLKDAHDRVKERADLRNRAEKDALCGIYNRAAGESLITLRLGEQEEGRQSSAAMFIFDLDDFKSINDSLGHSSGDAVLRAFAAVLRQVFRRDDVVFRLGGDEFAAFARNLPLERIEKIYERIILKLEEPLACGVRVNACAGVAYSPGGRHTYDDFYMTADKALYIAKEGGKGKSSILCLYGNGS
ncbi:GGDEF domain-containing protein [Desulfovibrio sp. 86]|nr:GGDEF domain-containing protein [Desulfovibrio sp. 86]